MRIAVILVTSLLLPQALLGLWSPVSYAAYYNKAPLEVQRYTTGSYEIPLVKDDIVLKLRPQYPVDDPTVKSSRFGYRSLSNCNNCSTFHHGIDYPLSDLNKNVYSTMSGVISQVQRSGEYGIHVIVEHVIYPDELVYTSIYAHLRPSAVTNSLSIGDRVTKGQLLGYIGQTGLATGPHLHFEIHRNGQILNPRVFFEKNMEPDSIS